MKRDSRAVLGVLAIVGAALSGCSGHGEHTSATLTAATERMAAFKSGVEWDMARQQFLAGDLEKALRTVDKSIALNGSVARSHTLRGRILMEQGRLEAARESFATARAIDPSFVEAHYYEGVALERLSDIDGALERYLAAADLDGDNPQHLIAAADMLIEQRRPDDAERMLRSRLARLPHNPGIRQTLGHIATLRGETDRAADLLDEARLLAPDDLTILEELARAQVEAQRYGEAEFNLSRVIAADKARARRDLQHLRARCLVALNRPLEARDVLLGLTRDAEGAADVAAWSDLGRVALKLKDPARVRIAAGRIAALSPASTDATLLLALLQREQGNLGGALALLDAAAAEHPGDPAVWKARGLILKELGRSGDAADSLARALALSPGDAQASSMLTAVRESE